MSQLCTLAQVKARIPVPDTDDDALITELIEGVSGWIEEATGRRLTPDNAATYVVDTIAGPLLEVRRGIRTVTSLEVAQVDQPSSGGSYTAIAAASIVLRPAPIDRRDGWPADTILVLGAAPAFRTVINGARIVGDFGFAATPAAIQSVAIDAVVSAYQARGNPSSATIGADERAIFPWATFFSPGSPQARTIGRYRGGLGIA